MAGELGAFQGDTLASGDGEIDLYHIAKVADLGYIARVDKRAANLEELHDVPAFLMLVGAVDSHWRCQPNQLYYSEQGNRDAAYPDVCMVIAPLSVPLLSRPRACVRDAV